MSSVAHALQSARKVSQFLLFSSAHHDCPTTIAYLHAVYFWRSVPPFHHSIYIRSLACLVDTDTYTHIHTPSLSFSLFTLSSFFLSEPTWLIPQEQSSPLFLKKTPSSFTCCSTSDFNWTKDWPNTKVAYLEEQNRGKGTNLTRKTQGKEITSS